MIIPDNLQPLPVAPVPEEESAAKALESEAFVSDRSVRQLLVGPLTLEHEPTMLRSDGEEFVGRSSSPFISLAGREAFADAPAKTFTPSGPHPALAASRRAAPPVPRAEVEGNFGRRHRSESFLVIGMGVAAITVMVAAVFSGFTPFHADPTPPVPAVSTVPFEAPAVEPGFHGNALAYTGEDAAMP